MPRYVILWHEAGPGLGRANHFDLLFEEGADARAWFVERPIESGVEQLAGKLPRHRLFYFDYEGPVSGDRGAVTRWDWGSYEVLLATADRFEVDLDGRRLRGTLRMALGRSEEWLFRFEAHQGSRTT